MKDLLVLRAHLLTTLAKLLGPGGARALAGPPPHEAAIAGHQSVEEARTNLSAFDRILFRFWSLFLAPRRILQAAIIIRPSTPQRFHDALKKRKYRLPLSSYRKGTPGPKGPSQELIRGIANGVEKPDGNIPMDVPVKPTGHTHIAWHVSSIREVLTTFKEHRITPSKGPVRFGDSEEVSVTTFWAVPALRPTTTLPPPHRSRPMVSVRGQVRVYSLAILHPKAWSR